MLTAESVCRPSRMPWRSSARAHARDPRLVERVDLVGRVVDADVGVGELVGRRPFERVLETHLAAEVDPDPLPQAHRRIPARLGSGRHHRHRAGYRSRLAPQGTVERRERFGSARSRRGAGHRRSRARPDTTSSARATVGAVLDLDAGQAEKPRDPVRDRGAIETVDRCEAPTRSPGAPCSARIRRRFGAPPRPGPSAPRRPRRDSARGRWYRPRSPSLPLELFPHPARLALDRLVHLLDRDRRAVVFEAAVHLSIVVGGNGLAGRSTTTSPRSSTSSSTPGCQPCRSRTAFGMITCPLLDSRVLAIAPSPGKI